jgi:ABC-type phosphate/phosphonate transport system substrate-binding protein
MPPIVVSPSLSEELRKCLQTTFIEMHLSAEGASVLHTLGIDRFEPGHDELYDDIDTMVPRKLVR